MSKPICFFKEKCFNTKRREHFIEFSHPHLEELKQAPDSVTYRKQYDILCDLGIIRIKTNSNDRAESILDFDEKKESKCDPEIAIQKENTEEEKILKRKVLELETELKMEIERNSDMACRLKKVQNDLHVSEKKRLLCEKEKEMLQKEIQSYKNSKIEVNNDSMMLDQDQIQNKDDEFKHSIKRKYEKSNESRANQPEASLNEGLITEIEKARDFYHGSLETMDRIKYWAYNNAITSIRSYPRKITTVPKVKEITNVGPSTIEIIRKYLEKNI